MLYISYGSVCEMDTAKKDIAEIEKMLKELIKSPENKHLNPWPLEPSGTTTTHLNILHFTCLN